MHRACEEGVADLIKQAPSSLTRVRALRERRQAQGMTRIDLYAHPDDHAALKKLAAKLAKSRAPVA